MEKKYEGPELDYRIVNMGIIPDKYKIEELDHKAIRLAIYNGVTEIPGLEIFPKKIIIVTHSTCPKCKGSGRILIADSTMAFSATTTDITTVCDICKGTGTVKTERIKED